MSVIIVVVVNVEDGLLVETAQLPEHSEGTGATFV